MDDDNIINDNYIKILKGIFIFTEEDKKFKPILTDNAYNNIKYFFDYFSNENDIKIINSLEIIFNIFKQSLEIAIIISNFSYFENQINYTFFHLLIDLYMKTETKNIQEIIIQIFQFLLKNIEIKRNIYDYHLNKLYKEYKNKNLSSERFIKYIKFLSILYGYNNNYETLEPRNYFYFTNQNSSIEIPFPSSINFLPINGFSIVFWFNIEKFKNQNSTILQLKTSDDQIIIISLSENNELEIKVNSDIINSLNIPLKKGIWNQLKFAVTNSKRNKSPEFHLFLWENHLDKYTYYKKEKIKNLKFREDIELLSIIFFKNFIGKFTTIIFYSIDNLSLNDENNVALNYQYGIYRKNQFIEFSDNNEKKNVYHPPIVFMITPISFDLNNYLIIDPMSRIKGKLVNLNNQNINYNNVKIYRNSSINIYKLGGINIFLPIFEIIYKSFQNENCFKEVIYLLYFILDNQEKNIIDALKSYFIPVLSLFLEKFNSNLFTFEIIEKFIQIQNNIINLNYDFPKNEFSDKILFNLKILRKYSPDLLNKLWELTLRNIDKFKEYFPNLTIFSPFLLELCNNNNLNENLFEILKKIISYKKTKDIERCNFFKLLSNENLSINLIINIIDLFTYYFNQESECELIQKQSSVIYLLKHNCLNELIFTLTNENLIVKKRIIDFISFMIEKYYNQIQEFERTFKKNKNEKYQLEINDYTEIIKYNITINETNEFNKSLELNNSSFSNSIIDKRRVSDFSYSKKFNISESYEENFSLMKGRTYSNIFNLENNIPERKIMKKNTFKSEKTPKIEKKKIFEKNEENEIKKSLNKEIDKIKNESLEKKLSSDSSSYISDEESVPSNKSIDFITNLSRNEIEIKEKNIPYTSKNKNNFKFDFSQEKILFPNKNNKRRKSKSLNILRNKKNNNNNNDNDNNKNGPYKKTKSAIINLKFLNLEIDIDNINEESENDLNNFGKKIKLLAQHCVDYINGIDNDENCKSEKYDINFHLDNNLSNNKKNYNNNIIDIIQEEENENYDFCNQLDIKNSSNINKFKNNENQFFIKEKEENEKKNLDISLSLNELFQITIKNNLKDHIKDSFIDLEFNKSIDHLYILDFMIVQCRQLKNLKLILNTLTYLNFNKPNNNQDIKKEKHLEEKNDYWKSIIKIYFQNKNLINFLVDIMFSCYLKLKVNKNEINIFDDENIKEENYLEGYLQSRALFIEIYFDNINSKFSCNNMISDLFPYTLNFQNNYIYNKNDKYNDYIYSFLRDIFTKIIDKYIEILQNTNPILYEKKINQKIKKNQDNNKSIEWTNFIQFISLFFEFSILFKNAKNIYDSKSNFLEMKNNNNIPSIPLYVLNGAFFNLNNDMILWADYYNYEKIFNLIKNIWSQKTLFNICKINIKEEIKEKEVYSLSINEIDKIIHYFIETKDNLEQLNFEILFLSYNSINKNTEYFLPLINSITTQTSYLITSLNDNEKNYNNLKYWINEYQFYIIFLILGSCYNKEKKKILDKYDFHYYCLHLYYNLAFNIGFIFYCFYEQKDSFVKNLFHIVIKNITRIYSKIIKLTEEKNESFFIFSKKKIDLTSSPIIHLNQDYIITKKKPIEKIVFNQQEQEIKNTNVIFCENDYSSNDYMSIKYLEENEEKFGIILYKNKKVYNHSEILFNSRMYYLIYYNRFLNKNNIISIFNDFEYSESYGKNYKKLYENIKIDNLNLITNNKEREYNNFIEGLLIKKRLRKIKKELFSWNNTYSDFDTFYINYKEKLKYKLLYHLTKDLTNPILIPILDFEYNIPTFSKYNIQNIFEENYRNFYNTDLKIFPKETPQFSNYKKNNQNEFECCYICQTHHIKGIIKYNDKIEFYPLFSNDENKLFYDKDEEYQEEKKNCYGSIFKTNNNYKDLEFIRQILIHNIIIIFKRKYFYRDNSIEIFTSSNKSFYFKFKTENIRNDFLNIILKTNYINFSEIKLEKRTIGYYKKHSLNQEIYSNIENISKNWKNNKISNLEYLMWLNIYGNRSYRDLHQYPIMPWLLINYDIETEIKDKIVEKDINNYLINNYKRDFNLPIGLMKISEESIKRSKLYFENFKTMCLDLIDDNKININPIEIEEINDEIKTNNLDLELLYKDLKINYEKIPYLFGSHFSNATYISHYLIRLFPYCLTSIEIQINNFDTPERLFFNLEKCFLSVSSEKCDLRELTPEFFSLPEIFENINKLNLGYLENEEEEEENKLNKEKLRIENVYLPKWAKNNKNFFIMKNREILENDKIDINNWIDLIFGINQRGKGALKKGNIYYPYSYDGVMNQRIDFFKKENEILEVNCILNFFELGVHPIKVLKDEKKKSEKKKIKKYFNNNIIINCPSLNDGKNKQYTKNPIFISTFFDKTSYNGIESLFILLDNFEKEKIGFIESKDKIYCDTKHYSQIFGEENQKKHLYKNILISSFKNNTSFIITGFLNGNIIYVKLNDNKENEKNIVEIRTSNPIISKRDNSIITCLEIDNNEEFIYAGTEKGSIIINQILNDGKIRFFSMKNNHSEKINYINSNIRLNMFIDCSYDNYIHIYIMPKVQLIKSLYNNFSYGSLINYSFLSSSPLPSFTLYTNQNYFISFSLNGDKLDIIQEQDFMISPIIYYHYDFMDYLIYGTGNNYLIIRKFPFMEQIYYVKLQTEEIINHSFYLENIKYKPIKFIQISNNKMFIYVIFDNSKNIIICPLNLDK